MKFKADVWIDPDENISVLYQEDAGDISLHTHEFIEIVFIDHGKGIHTINNKPFEVTRGDVLFINFKSTHKFESKDKMSQYNIIINPAFFSDELIDSKNAMDILTLSCFNEFTDLKNDFNFCINFSGREIIEIQKLIELMFIEFKNKKTGYDTILKSYVNILLTKIFRVLNAAEDKKIDSSIKNLTPEVLDYIDANYNTHITLQDLAKKSFYNPSYLSKVFKECYGRTFKEYLGEIRINMAIDLLLTTSGSVEDICLKVGYSDKKHFYKLFRKLTGKTPDAFRKNAR